MWEIIAVFCFVVHFIATSRALFEAIRGIVVKRFYSTQPREMELPPTIVLTAEERWIYLGLFALNLVLTVLVIFMALSRLKNLLNSKQPFGILVAVVAIAFILLFTIYSIFKEKLYQQRMSLREPNTKVLVGMAILETFAFNVLATELVTHFII